MTSSELYHGLALDGYETVATRFDGNKIILEVELKRRPCCSGCSSAKVVRRGGCPRRSWNEAVPQRKLRSKFNWSRISHLEESS